MKRRVFLLVISALGFSVSVSGAEDLILKIQKKLGEVSKLEADFEQIKYLEGQDIQLKSSGRLLVRGQDVVQWCQIQPFRQEFVLSANGMKVSIEGEPDKDLGKGENPALFEILNLIKSLFVGDIDSLLSLFTIEDSGGVENGWTLVLKPKKKPYDLIFKKIVLEGKDCVQKINIDELEGDRISIELTNIKIKKN